MRLLLDECSGAHEVLSNLRAAGHDVQRSLDVVGRAASDAAVLAYAAANERAVLTMSCADFLALTDGTRHPGLLLHHRDADRGLTYEQIVSAIANIEQLYRDISGMAFALDQWAW